MPNSVSLHSLVPVGSCVVFAGQQTASAEGVKYCNGGFRLPKRP